MAGKLVGGKLYVHRSALRELNPADIRCVEYGWELAEEPPFDVVKLDEDRISFLSYPRFIEDDHPALAESWSVNPRDESVRYRDYRHSDNPPILHRKELFVREDHPHYERFREVTEREEREGLLDHPPGHLLDWRDHVRSRRPMQ